MSWDQVFISRLDALNFFLDGRGAGVWVFRVLFICVGVDIRFSLFQKFHLEVISCTAFLNSVNNYFSLLVVTARFIFSHVPYMP